MLRYTTTIHRFGEQGEKTGWTYIVVPEDIAQQLKPGNKKSFRVKGKLDQWPFAGLAVLPMGDGQFILTLNAAIRKAIGKRKGAQLEVQIAVDTQEPAINAVLLECLADEPTALAYFDSLPKGHRLYFSKWIESAKTNPTFTKRIAMAVNALSRKMGYGEMIREAQGKK
jgi:Domain of unknown function (DUF1905)/Bacteriocin-protection, YdeI or OmpD-Associated